MNRFRIEMRFSFTTMLIVLAMLAAILSLPVSSYAFGSNPPLPNTGAPGQGTCSTCHGTLTVGSGVSVNAPKSYTPGGAAIPLTVTIPTTGGFELEVVTQTSNVQAGALATGANVGTSTLSGIQFAYSTGETTSWNFTWTPPATNVGSVVLYVTGGTNGSNYSNNFVMTPAASAAPSISSFVAGSSSITAGNSTTLTGTFSNGTGTVDNGVGSVTSGTAVTVKPAVTTTYTLTVSGTGTPATAKVTVTVTPAAQPPSISSFVAGSSSITAGNSTTLTGTFSNGTGTVDNGVGSVTSGTAVTVKPAVTTTYTLTVSGTGTPATAKVTVTVTPAAQPPSISSFVAGSSSITAGNSTTLTGTFSNGTGTVDNGVGSVTSGTAVTVKPTATTTYTLTVSGTGTPATAKVTVTVTSTAPAPDFSLSANPSSVTVAPGSSAPTTITITPTGGFSAGTVSFSPPGLPTGLSATFGAISSTGTSTLTFSATSSAAPMTIGVTITGTAGSLSHTAMVNLTISGGSSGSGTLAPSPTSLSFRFAGGAMPNGQKLSVSDSSGTASFSASASGGSWLSVSPGNGSAPGSVTVNVNPSRMSAGTYNGAIQLSASGATGVSVPVTLTITSSTCSDDCSGGGGSGGSSGSMTAQPYSNDPSSSGTVAAVWVEHVGSPTGTQSTRDPGLLLSKNGGAPSGSWAGAIIHNVSGSSLTELGFDYRDGGQCTTTSPRFIVVTTDNITHVVGGCSKGTVTSTGVAGWKRVRFNLADTSQTNPAITPGETLSSITLVLDLGPEAGASAAGGLVVIDDIDVNGTFVTPTYTTRFSDN